MKSVFLFIGLYLFIFLPFHSVRAADIESCRTAWSEAFDSLHAYLIENTTDSLAVFLTQNDISPVDMWSGYRTVTERYRCYLNAVCAAVNMGGDLESPKILSPSNVLHGAIPGVTAVCFPDTPLNEVFTPLAGKYRFDPTVFDSCNFADGMTPEEQREIRLQMYSNCTAHADIMSEIYARAVRNLLMADAERKTAGYFSSQTVTLTEGIQRAQEVAGKFVSHFNSVMGRICTLAYPD